MKGFILYPTLVLIIFSSCRRSKDCDIERISTTDKEWMIPMESFATIGFKGDRDHHELLRSTSGSRQFSDCSGWFGSGNKYEIIEKEFEKDSCTTPRCQMKMTISRNAEDERSKILFEFFDFSHYIDRDQDKKTERSMYVPGLKKGVLIWTFKNKKSDAEISSINYSKEYGIVGYQKNTGETFVMDSVFARPYLPF